MLSNSFRSGRSRSLLAALAVIVAVVSLLALPPLRAAADQLLSIFRVQKLVFVPVSRERLDQLNKLNFDKDTLFVAKPTVGQAAPPRTVASAAEAASAVGGTVGQPSAFPSAPISSEFKVSSPNTMQFQVNVAAARQLLELMGVDDVSIPDALGAAPIAVDVPAFVQAHYQGVNYDMTLHQGRSPSVTCPMAWIFRSWARPRCACWACPAPTPRWPAARLTGTTRCCSPSQRTPTTSAR